ncbi:Hsp70 family protein [Planctomycetota bacterium]
MALIPDPIFYDNIRRGHGSKRKLVHIRNTDAQELKLVVRDIDKPEWVDLEGTFAGGEVKIPASGHLAIIANLNTSHKYFPRDRCEEKVVIRFNDGTELVIQITLRITELVEPFRGVFAIDFGTTNSCYAYVGTASDAQRTGGAAPSSVSPEIPSVIFFHDVRDREFPKVTIGNQARHDITESSSQTYSYAQSIKRHFGRHQTINILDRWAGARRGHQQEYLPEEIASFILRELIVRAEEELDKRIGRVVATFPPMFSSDRKAALARGFKRTFESLGRTLADEDLVMVLDEATAGTFNYIYGPMLDSLRRTNRTEEKAHLLSFDFGGGTIDIALVTAEVKRIEGGKIKITTELKGLTGEADYGGDNVTLALFKILKTKMARSIAKSHLEAEQVVVAEQSKEDEPFDPWAASAKPKADEMDIWGAAADAEAAEEEDKKKKEEEAAAAAVAAAAIDPEVQDIECLDPEDAYLAACRTIDGEQELLEELGRSERPTRDLVEELEKQAGKYRGPEEARVRAEEFDRALETLIPTKFTTYEDKDPRREVLSRRLFQELFQEADALKIIMAKAADQKTKVQGSLKRAAKYAGIDKLKFNEIELTLEDLQKCIEPEIVAAVDKAYHLSDMVRSRGTRRGIVVKGSTDEVDVKVLMFGNSSNLPIVKETIVKSFKLDEHNLVFDRATLKNAVARGASEEYSLRQAFGATGLIQYDSIGFLDRLPYALGLLHKDLELVGFKGGFCPIFERGVELGSECERTSEKVFMIYRGMKELAIYADHMDGATPRYVGFIDFSKPVGKVDLAADSVGGEHFSLRFRLTETREIQATSLETGEQFALEPQAYVWNNPKNPFSGVH